MGIKMVAKRNHRLADNPYFNDDAWQRLYRFDDGYGASVVYAYYKGVPGKTEGATEREKNSVEVAVIQWYGEGEDDYRIMSVRGGVPLVSYRKYLMKVYANKDYGLDELKCLS